MKTKIKPSTKTRVTITTVAADAGVSVAAVSKVLRNAYGVSELLRVKVQASIDKLNYRPSMAARGMRGQIFTVGVLLVEIANPFLPQIIDGAREVFADASYQTLLGVGESKSTLEASMIESMIDHGMDGLILVAPQMQGDQLAHYAHQIPMVVIGHHEATATAFDTVNSDDQEGAGIAIRFFVQKNFTDIAMLSLTLDDPHLANVVSQREIGYRKAMHRAKLDQNIRIIKLAFDAEKRPAEIHSLLRTLDQPRAIFCWSDIDAIHVLDSAKRLGIKVPEELALIGYDNSSPAALASIALSSIEQSGKRLGALAAEILLSRIGGRNIASHLLIEPSLICRQTD